MAHFGVDIDGCLDENPALMGSILNALRSAGHRVTVMTGCSAKVPTQGDFDEKAQYLKSLGLANAWDDMAIFGDPPHKAKAKYCKTHHVDCLIDNDVQNLNRASKYCTTLAVWNSLIPPEDKSSTKVGL